MFIAFLFIYLVQADLAICKIVHISEYHCGLLKNLRGILKNNCARKGKCPEHRIYCMQMSIVKEEKNDSRKLKEIQNYFFNLHVQNDTGISVIVQASKLSL